MAFITLLIGFALGFFLHLIIMKISFKQRTIDNKIKIYDSIITSWVKMRNEIFNPIDKQRGWVNAFYAAQHEMHHHV